MLWALQSRSPHWDTRYWCFGFVRKVFLSTIFLIIIVYPWNETKLDTRNNLYSLSYWYYNHVLLIGTHNINALHLQEKLFFLPFSLLLNFILEMRQTLILVIISILVVIGTTIMFSSLAYTMLMLWIYEKRFSSHHFLYNHISMKWYKLGYL